MVQNVGFISYQSVYVLFWDVNVTKEVLLPNGSIVKTGLS